MKDFDPFAHADLTIHQFIRSMVESETYTLAVLDDLISFFRFDDYEQYVRSLEFMKTHPNTDVFLFDVLRAVLIEVARRRKLEGGS
jgi:hypothetical protein